MVRAEYDRIYSELRSEIEDGTYPYGSLLPSQAVLVERFGCAHNTVRKALALLARQGYCQPIHGKGVRVIWAPEDGCGLFVTGGTEDFTDQPYSTHDTSRRVNTCEIVPCTAELSLLTGLAEGTEILKIECVVLVEGVARISETGYVRLDALGELCPERAFTPEEVLVRARAIQTVTRKRSITFEPATDRDRDLFAPEDCSHVAVITMRTFDDDAMPLGYLQSRHHPDYFRFHDTVIANELTAFGAA